MSYTLKGMKLPTNDNWILVVKYGRHNHVGAQYLKGYFFRDYLSQEEMSILVNMSKSNIKPKEIE